MKYEKYLLLELAKAVIAIDDELCEYDMCTLTVTRRDKIKDLVKRIKDKP